MRTKTDAKRRRTRRVAVEAWRRRDPASGERRRRWRYRCRYREAVHCLRHFCSSTQRWRRQRRKRLLLLPFCRREGNAWGNFWRVRSECLPREDRWGEEGKYERGGLSLSAASIKVVSWGRGRKKGEIRLMRERRPSECSERKSNERTMGSRETNMLKING